MITPRNVVGRSAREIIPDDIDILGPEADGMNDKYFLQTNSPGIPIITQEVLIDKTQLVFSKLDVARYISNVFSAGYTQLLEKI